MTSREITVSPEQFEKQLAHLKKSGYRSISMDKLDRIINNLEPIETKDILITFDDGYEDNLFWAVPLLKKYGFSAVFFVITNSLAAGYTNNLWYDHHAPDGYHRFLDFKQITELLEQGFLIGSHSCSHPDLNQLTDTDLDAELNGSRLYLENRFGITINGFAYPRGIFNEQVVQATKNAGYQFAFTTLPGINHFDMNPLLLKRTVISASDTVYLFSNKMQGNLDWLVFKELPVFRNIIDAVNKFLIISLRSHRNQSP